MLHYRAFQYVKIVTWILIDQNGGISLKLVPYLLAQYCLENTVQVGCVYICIKEPEVVS